MKKNFTCILLLLLTLQFSATLQANQIGDPIKLGIKDDRIAVQQISDDWVFFWKELIDPKLMNIPSVSNAVNVELPSYWTDYKVNGANLPGIGYGSFCKTLVLPKGYNHPIGLLVPTIDVAFRFYINGELICGAGEVGTSNEQEIPGYSPTLVKYNPTSDTLHILFHVSNFHHRRGGIWKEFIIGDYSEVSDSFNNKEWAIDFISLGILFSFGVFFLIFSFYNRVEKSLPFLSMAFLFVLVRGVSTNHFPLMLLTDISWEWMIRLEYIGNFGAVVMGMWGFFHIKPVKWIKYILLSFTACLIIVFLAILLLDVRWFAYSIYLFNLYLGTFFILFCFQLFYIIKASEKFPWLFFTGVFLVTFAALNDLMIAFAKTLLFNFYILPIVFIIFVFILSVGFFRRFYETFEREKLLSKELTQLTIELENIVEKRTAQVNEKNKIIESQNATLQEDIQLKNRILSIIGHDIRSPLSFLTMGLELVIDKNLPEESRMTFIQKIIFSANNLFLLVDNLLSWGLSQNKQLKLFAEDVDLSLLIDRIVDQFLPITENKEIVLKRDIPIGTTAWCDENTVTIVIRNLLSNAVKFTPREGEISMSFSLVGDFVEVKVADTGVGISLEKLNQINHGIEINSSEGTDHEKGTGLGLILCKELVHLNHGKFAVESELQKGSCFTFTLPKMKMKHYS